MATTPISVRLTDETNLLVEDEARQVGPISQCRRGRARERSCQDAPLPRHRLSRPPSPSVGDRHRARRLAARRSAGQLPRECEAAPPGLPAGQRARRENLPRPTQSAFRRRSKSRLRSSGGRRKSCKRSTRSSSSASSKARVRLLLDAHLSGARIANALRSKGHDVRALVEEPASEGLEDAEVLALAAVERRILVTLDVADFPSAAQGLGRRIPATRRCDSRLRDQLGRVQGDHLRRPHPTSGAAASAGLDRPGRRAQQNGVAIRTYSRPSIRTAPTAHPRDCPKVRARRRLAPRPASGPGRPRLRPQVARPIARRSRA